MVLFSATLSFIVVKSSLAKMLAKGSIDNQTNRHIIKNHTRSIFKNKKEEQMIGAINKNHMQKGGIKKPLAIGLGVGIVVIVVVVIIVTQFFSGLFSGVEPVIAEFMEAGAAGDVEAAYACWPPESVTEEEIAEFVESNYDDVFAGYEHLNISSWESESSAGITTCDVSGAVIYTGDKSLPFEASLVKENDVWKLTDIYIGY